LKYIDSNGLKDILNYDRRDLITINLFWIGFVVYTASWTLSASKQANYIICQMFQLLGMAIFIPACIQLVKFEFDNIYQQVIFVLLLIWSSLIFVRGIFDIESFTRLKEIIFNPWFGGFLYFVPVVMLFPKKLILYKKIFDVIVILSVFYILYDIIFISDLMEPDGQNERSRDIVEYFSKTLSFPVIFILLTYIYHSKQRNFFALFVLLLTIFFSMVRARRGMLSMAVGPMAFVYIFFLLDNNIKLIQKIISLGLVLVVIIGLIYAFNNDSIEMFSLLEERGTDDTRSGVEKNFIDSMEGMDWMIGRGMLGEYYSPTIDVGNYRGTIETDYLNIILKGGYIQLVLLLLILIPAMINGIFRSKNTLSRVAGLWIFVWLLSTYPATVQVFTLYYILVWISVGICYSKTIRNMPEKTLLLSFKLMR
jgi:hypothetical protein